MKGMIVTVVEESRARTGLRRRNCRAACPQNPLQSKLPKNVTQKGDAPGNQKLATALAERRGTSTEDQWGPFVMERIVSPLRTRPLLVKPEEQER